MSSLLVSATGNILDDQHVSFEERKKQLDRISREEREVWEREKKSPYGRFWQMNGEHTKDLLWLADYPKAHKILVFLLDQMDNYNAVVCSYEVIQEVLKMSHSTVARSIKLLKEKGFIAILKSGTSNVYVVNHSLAWKSWGTNVKYCKFPANVVLSANENKEYLEGIEKIRLNQISTKGEENYT